MALVAGLAAAAVRSSLGAEVTSAGGVTLADTAVDMALLLLTFSESLTNLSWLWHTFLEELYWSKSGSVTLKSNSGKVIEIPRF